LSKPAKLLLDFAILISLTLAAPGARAQHARFVDPFLGVAGGGNVFPGPSMPFGEIKPGPDMDNGPGRDANAGWSESGNIRGFSQTHVSGTGGGARYGNILVTATTGQPAPSDSESPRANEHASAGYYSVTLARYGIGVEFTAARRAAIYRFRFPQGQRANLLFDVSRCLVSGLRTHENQIPVSSSVQILSPTEIAGSTTVKGGWNKQPVPYTVYFYAVTDTPAASSGTWLGGQLHDGSRQARGASTTPAGAWLTFAPPPGKPVLMKIAISFVSIGQARRNLAAEIPAFDFDAVQSAAVAAWNSALSTIDVDGQTPEQAQIFYTALYHTMLMPSDRTAENPLWQSTEPYYDDYYAIWDIFRTSGPMLTLIAPERETSIVRALVDLYRHEGWLPDARSGNYNGRTQGGSNAEFMLTDAYVKGLPGIDWKTALAAEIHDAEVPPADHLKEGRGGLDDWHKLGYVSIEGSDRSGSVSMEYAADDFEIALLAKGLGDSSAYAKYLKRSANWQNLWDGAFSDGGFTGFIRPRRRDGAWLSPFTAMDSCTWGGDTFYEGNSWTYSFFVPQNVAGLIGKMGGPDTFVRRLDAFFDVPRRYDVGNEPGFLTPYLYNWAGRPDKTAGHVRAIIAASYHAGPRGLPGNDDSGAMSSWYIFGQIGIFPNAGQPVYLIGSPAYPRTVLHLAGGKDFIIAARNLSAKNIYVTAATLDGKPLDRDWLRHTEIISGGRLVLTMSSKPGDWGRSNPPPSTPAPQ
jgi:predicted alpha-1,2-mannosidase